MAGKNIVAIIPARGGSKGIPKKNIIDFCGKPLIAWSIQNAIQSELVQDVHVSSDSDEILEVSKAYGAKVIKRPSELALDTTPSELALIHALEHIEPLHKNVDLIVFLQVTSPLRLAEDIDTSIRMLELKIANPARQLPIKISFRTSRSFGFSKAFVRLLKTRRNASFEYI